MILNEGKVDNAEVTEPVMMEHKTKFFQHYNDRNVEGLKNI